MEFKRSCVLTSSFPVILFIAPMWNLNEKDPFLPFSGCRLFIAPMWNLNEEEKWSTGLIYCSFYCTYVEFKRGTVSSSVSSIILFIAPMWNLNKECKNERKQRVNLFIAPMWNLNVLPVLNSRRRSCLFIAPMWNLNNKWGYINLGTAYLFIAPMWNLNYTDSTGRVSLNDFLLHLCGI